MTIKARIVLFLSVLLLTIGSVGSFIILRENSARKTLERETPQAVQQVIDAYTLDILAQEINHYDEVLTQSARNYAFTGDKKWETRYNDAAPKLETAITAALSGGDAADRARFQSVDAANRALVAMERQSLTLADQGDLTGAQAVLESDAYTTQKSAYQNALSTHLTQRNAQSDRAIRDSADLLGRIIRNVEHSLDGNRQMYEGFMAFVVALFLILAGLIFRRILIPVGIMNRAAKSIAKGDLDQTIHVRSVKDEIGQLAGTFNTMTENLRKSYQLLEQRVEERTQDLAKFRLAAEQAHEHIVITDPDGVILYGNHAAEQLTGFTLKEMLGHTPRLWGKQMPVEFYQRFWNRIKAQKRTFMGELTNKRKSGERYLAEAMVTPILGKRGKVLFFVGIERDITKQREYVETLNRLAAIVDGTDDAIFSKSLDGTITSWNNGAVKLYGYTAKEAIGRSVEFLVPDERKEEVARILKRTAEGKPIAHYETVRLRKDGTLVDVSVSVSPIRDETGRVIGASTIARDNTREKEIERMKSDFVSLTSHQLKTPVAIIRGDVENLLSGLFGPLTKKQREYLEDIKATSIRNYTLISDLLNVSRIERGVIKVDLVPVRLTEVFDAVLHDYREAAAERKLQLKVEPFDTTLMALADREKFIQSIANAVNNALKYTVKGGITVRASLAKRLVTVEVQDTGKGMDETMQKKLFSRNLVLSGDPSPDHSSGLGLYIAKHFMQLQHGDVTVSSQPGKGSTFSFTIPSA